MAWLRLFKIIKLRVQQKKKTESEQERLSNLTFCIFKFFTYLNLFYTTEREEQERMEQEKARIAAEKLHAEKKTTETSRKYKESEEARIQKQQQAEAEALAKKHEEEKNAKRNSLNQSSGMPRTVFGSCLVEDGR